MFVKNCNLLFTSVKARNIITVHTRNQFIPAVPYPFIWRSCPCFFSGCTTVKVSPI